jgi:hypothetical protein
MNNQTRSTRISNALLATGLLAGLAACASNADPSAMTVTAEPVASAAVTPFPQKFQHAMCVRNVTGGEETNPMWASKVNDAGFHSALDGSLNGAGLSSGSTSCSFPIDANLLGLSQPSMGFDMTVTSHVNYKVYDASGQPVVLATIDAPFTAKMSDAFAGVKRLRLANEGSIRESIRLFFDKLRTTSPK